MIDYTNANTIVQSYLKSYGLESLSAWATKTLSENPSLDSASLQVLISDTPEFNARFPALKTLRQTGRAISVDAYMAYEDQTRQLLHTYGIPKEMYGTSESISNLLLNDVSTAEMNQRIQMAAQAAYSAPEETRTALRDQYGISGGNLVAYWLDPEKAQPLLEKQYAAATITGAAARQAIGIGITESERLAALGITGAAAEQGFAQVAQMSGLEAGSGETVNQQTLINAQFGDAAAQASVRRVQGGRVAQFQGGGQAAESQQGVVGLGSSSNK